MSTQTDDEIITEDAVARARAAMNGQRYQSPPAAVAALERRQLRRIDASATHAHAILDRKSDSLPSSPPKPTSEASADDVCRQLAAVMLSNAKVKRARRGHRADAEEQPATTPTYECAKCANAIAPDDEIYCAKCAGIDGADSDPADGARDCSGCGEPVGARCYCATCAGKDDDEQESAAAHHAKPAARGIQPKASWVTRRHNAAACKTVVGKIACPSCKGAKVGAPCRSTTDGEIVGHGACLMRMRAMDAVNAPRPRRNPDDDYYASINVG